MQGQNRAARRAAAKANGVKGQVFSQLVVIDDLGEDPTGAVALAIVSGIGGVIEQGGAPLERSAITLGSDHPDHPGKIVVEVKTDRRAPARKPLVLGLMPSLTPDE